MTERPFLDDTIRRIRNEIAEAAIHAGRDPQQVRLMAVTKTVPAQIVNQAIDCGIDLLGENRVQEYLEKADLYRKGCEVHFIGSLQTNKVKQIIERVELIHSVDHLRLARTIDRHAAAAGRIMPVLVEVNIGNEASKSGVLEQALSEFLDILSGMSSIRVEGLMAIPPAGVNVLETERYFHKMYSLFLDRKAENRDNVHMNVLSMGMSSDYRLAVKHGSTLVRIGSALFGQRNYAGR